MYNTRVSFMLHLNIFVFADSGNGWLDCFVLIAWVRSAGNEMTESRIYIKSATEQLGASQHQTHNEMTSWKA